MSKYYLYFVTYFFRNPNCKYFNKIEIFDTDRDKKDHPLALIFYHIFTLKSRFWFSNTDVFGIKPIQKICYVCHSCSNTATYYLEGLEENIFPWNKLKVIFETKEYFWSPCTCIYKQFPSSQMLSTIITFFSWVHDYIR